jgi:hypothetical protein
VPAPIAGQGIAWDFHDLGVVLGINRASHEVVFMRSTGAIEPLR